MHSLVQLEYIVALATYQQFSIAADKCFVTQPTLSMQIKKMENDLDVILFDRSKQPVVPTQIGERIVSQARIILSESKRIDEIIQENKETVKGELKLGIIPSVAPYLLPLFIGTLTSKYPELNIIIKELLTNDILKELENELLDVGIVSTPIPNGSYKETLLYREKIFIYCHPSHPFYKKNEIGIKELQNENIWLLSQGHCFRSQVINVCAIKEANNQLPFSYESASIETLIKIVDNEGGLTLIPELAINDLTASRQKRVKNIKEINPVREISLVTSRIFVKEQTLNALEKTVKETVPKELLSERSGERVEWN